MAPGRLIDEAIELLREAEVLLDERRVDYGRVRGLVTGALDRLRRAERLVDEKILKL